MTRPGSFQLANVGSQEAALEVLAKMVARDAIDERIHRAAVQITRDCKDRDDICELTAIFNALRSGDSRVPGLSKGLKYMADNFHVDQYWSPVRLLAEIEKGASAGDCDDHAMFAAALAASIGFRVGLRAWGRKNAREFQHVYAIALVPKEAPESETYEFGLDTSADVGDPHAGWQPEEGRVLTALIEESDYGA